MSFDPSVAPDVTTAGERRPPEEKRSVALLGKGDLAVRVGEWFLASEHHELRAVVPVIPEPDWTRSLAEWAVDAGVPNTVESGDYRDLEEGVDLAFSVFYDRILEAAFLGECGQALNLHNSPLPRYRGVNPINWALKNGEPEHGVTIHEIVEEVDAGPIASQVTFTIYPEFDEVIDVYRRALRFGWTLFRQTMPVLHLIEPRAQDESNATYYSRDDASRLGDRRDFTRQRSD